MTIRIVATGGTIASRLDPATGAVVPADSAEDLVAAVPGIDVHGPFEFDQVDQVNGWNMTPSVMHRTAMAVREALVDDGVDGVVITHGTDTAEETLYMVDLLAGDATRHGGVVMACAMRSAGEIGADGPRNLLNAAAVAGDGSARGRGALLGVNDELHHARWVTKTNTTNVSTFRSTPGGPVGIIEHGQPVWLLDSPGRPPVVADRGIVQDVALVKIYTGMDDAMLRWLVDDVGVAGIVVEATGAGNLPATVYPGIVHAVDRQVPVVVASRTWTGRTAAIYGGDGGGVSLEELGCIRSNGLNAAKARIALMVALGQTRDRDELAAWFASA